MLPSWLQAIAWANPAAHVFEGMRAVINTGVLPGVHLAWAIGLNVFYLGLMIAWFHHTFNVCKERGSLVRVGE